MAASSASHHITAPDAHLVTRALDGNVAAFEELFRRHAHPAWRLAQAVAGNRPAAATAVADGFTRVMARARRDGSPPASFRVGLALATRQAALSGAPAGRTGANGRADGPTPLLDAFPTLPERWRSVIWLTEVEGGTAAQAGAVLALSTEATEGLARRAVAGIRERSGESGDLKAGLRPIVGPMPAGLSSAATARYQEWHRELSAADRRRMTLIGPVAPWAEKALAGAALAILGLGIVGAALREGKASRSPELAAPAGRIPSDTGAETTARPMPQPASITYTGTIIPAPAPVRRPGAPDGARPPAAPPATVTPANNNPGTPAAVPPLVPPTTPPGTPTPPAPGSNPVQITLGLNLGGSPIGVSIGTDGVSTDVGDSGQLVDLVVETGGLLPPIDVGEIIDDLLPELPGLPPLFGN